MKIVKALEDSDISIKAVTNTIKNDIKNQDGKGIGILASLLDSTILSSLGQDKEFLKKALIPPHSLTNFEIQNYYKDKPRFNGVYSRDNLYKIKNGAYIINFDKHANIGTHWVALYVNLYVIYLFIVHS